MLKHLRSRLLVIIAFNIIFQFPFFCVKAQKSSIQYLTGKGAEQTRTWDFYCSAGTNSGEWKSIEVPSCWEQQGFGQYNYGHVLFDDRLKETGHYKYEFEGKPEWENKQIDLVFEGVMTDCEVVLNGEIVGKHQGAFYEFSFDVSDLLKKSGKNTLEVLVQKHSANESVNRAERKADYWIFGGIFRPVYLKINPKEHIQKIAIDAKASGLFKADIIIEGLEKARSVEITITDFQKKAHINLSESLIKGQDSLRLEGTYPNPKLWSCEFPNRYYATFTLFDNAKNVIHQVTKKIGFRTIEVRAQDGIYINNVKTKLKGVNSHTFHPDFGRTSSEELSIQTVNIIKDMNMNAIRFSHYPHDKHLLNACDSLGLYVLNELAGWQKPAYDTEIGRKLLKEMIVRDVNNPSVILWDNGNEGGWNTEYDKDFVELDIQKREVLHPWGAFGKMVTSHYIDYEYLSFDNYAQRHIFFPTELLHGLYDGGHGAGLEDYWQKMWDHPLCAGGFLWVLADEAIKRTDTGELDTDGNHAPDGILGPYFEKEGSFYTIKKIWSPIHLQDRYITSEFDGNLFIENRFQFTNFSQCKFQYSWVKYSKNGSREVMGRHVPEVPDLAPFEKGFLKISLQEDWDKADALEIIAHDPHQRHIYTWSMAVSKPEKVIAEHLKLEKGKKLELKETDNSFIFKTPTGIKYVIGKKDGLLKSVSTDNGNIPFKNGPIIIHNSLKMEKVELSQMNETYKVAVSFEGMKNYFEWTIESNGLLRLDVEYQPRSKTYLAGIDFTFPESEISSIKWMGNGPFRVWKNRLKGSEFGVWEKKYNNTITGHSGFEYPEFKGYHSNLYWAEIAMNDKRMFRVYSGTEDIFFKLYNPQDAPEPAKCKVEHSEGDISFLHGIPAIGTKFKTADKLGPQSLPYSFVPKRVNGGKLSMNLIFDFNEYQNQIEIK